MKIILKEDLIKETLYSLKFKIEKYKFNAKFFDS